MGLLEALVFASFGFTGACWAWTWRQIERIKNNHFTHVEQRLKVLEEKAGIES